MNRIIYLLVIGCFIIFSFKDLSRGTEVYPLTLNHSKVTPSCIQFADLWKNAETGNPAPEYAYQCAIRLSITLHRVGINMKSFSQNTVKPAVGRRVLGRIILDGLPVATRADEMASWLKQYPFCGLGKAENITGSDWKGKVYGRTGIISFSSYWGVNQSGGYIDLWNKSRFPYPSPSFSIDGTFGILANFSRFTFGGWGLYNGGSYYGITLLPNLADSKKITFFEIR